MTLRSASRKGHSMEAKALNALAGRLGALTWIQQAILLQLIASTPQKGFLSRIGHQTIGDRIGCRRETVGKNIEKMIQAKVLAEEVSWCSVFGVRRYRIRVSGDAPPASAQHDPCERPALSMRANRLTLSRGSSDQAAISDPPGTTYRSLAEVGAALKGVL